uniref:Uncharacterized protein n=1 Tax=Cronobacter sp. TaxID=1888169 RepID=A0A6G6AQC9_9ENTR|nr:hypothetical protein [Cronobacter sp.]UFD94780.1 hypothetical protein [Enterobacter hormaechei]
MARAASLFSGGEGLRGFRQALLLFLSEYFECCNYMRCAGARRVATGAT